MAIETDQTAQTAPFPNLIFKFIYADPPWEYTNKKTGGSMNSGAGQKYPTMSLTEICNLPVRKIADKKRSVLFLWVPTPLKYDIATSGLLESWDFEYKTTVYWRKIMRLGMGNWFRGQVEECWLCIRGDVKAFHLQIPNYIQTKVSDHSRKPRIFRGMLTQISKQFDLLPAIELFSRDRIEGWTMWGNELPTTEQKTLNVD